MSTHVRSTPKRTYQIWIEQSILGSHIDAYNSYLIEQGYADTTICFYLHSVAHFSHWLTRKKIDIHRIDEALVRSFVTVHLPACDCAGRCEHCSESVRAALGHLLRVLRLKGHIPPPCTGTVSPATQGELEHFDAYLDKVCGLASKTRVVRLHYVSKFLQRTFKRRPIDLTRLTPTDIQRFVTRHGEGCARGSIQVICSCLRTYLRFRAFKGERTEALMAAVPSILNWRLASLPKALTNEELRQFLAAFDRTSCIGQRDYAMARCLVDLGLRAGEVAGLRLENFDWREGTLRIVSTKGGRQHLLPLPVETGRAIVQYLQNARPKCASRSLFIRRLAPRDRPLNAGIVRWAMRCAYMRSGLSRPWSGTHILRHTVACRLINSGVALKDIADVLRHRSLDTTTIYTKIDLTSLSAVALPWPGRTS